MSALVWFPAGRSTQPSDPTSCFRGNMLALFYGVLYSHVHKFLQLAIKVNFIPPYLVVKGLMSVLGQSSVGTQNLDSGA